MAHSRTSDIFDQHNPQAAARESPLQQNNQTPPSASSSGTFTPSGEFKVVRRRNRVPLSCAPCRNRKLKCNRTQPCENCVKRGDSMSCSYAAPTSRKRQMLASPATGGPDEMRNRLDRLEGLVLSFMHSGSQIVDGSDADVRALAMELSPGSGQYPEEIEVESSEGDKSGRGESMAESGSDTEQVAQSLGIMKVDNGKAMYIGDAHWATVLNEVSEIKNYFANNKKLYEEQMVKVQENKARLDSTMPGPIALFGGARVQSFDEIVGQMPKRTVADKLIARYFNSYDPAVHILHPPSWYRQYQKYWENPQAVAPVWLAQTFAILCLAMNSWNRMDDEPPEYQGKSLAMAAHYRSLTAQCLIFADFTKPVSQMVETLVLYLHCEHARSRDAEVDVWVLCGMITRLAMRMGYHRDPKYYPNISPFQGELRRRVWTFIKQADIAFSFQVGQPHMIRQGDSDTELPRNLYDEDFDEEIAVVPPARPDDTPTPVSYMRAKASMSFEFGKIVEYLHRSSNCSYEEIMELDRGLRDTLARLPPHLRMRSLEDSREDSGAVIVQRFYLSIIYHKGQCVLHRKFLTKARESTRYTHSRRTCIDSSMELLSHQAALHYEAREGHQLHGMKVVISSLTAADFLLAAMIVALDLCTSTENASEKGSGDMYTWGSDRRGDMIRALEVSLGIWKAASDRSMEAFKASTVLTVMLQKMQTNRAPQARAVQNGNLFAAANINDTRDAFPAVVEEKPEHSAAMTLGMLSSGGVGTSAVAQFGGPFQTTDSGTNGAQPGSILASGFSQDQLNNGAQSAVNPMGFFNDSMLPEMDMSGGDVNFDWETFEYVVRNANFEPPVQATNQSIIPQAAPSQDLPQQPWPASVDPSLATAAMEGAAQQAFQAPNAYMGTGVGNAST